ncbi:MAG TPA: PRC-barrel domain-containing protein [Bauldia sp.]|nr:PRC-barrel domain-containing protein [Bauldia sp.]
MKTLLTTTALAALLAAGPALAQSDTAPATTEPPAATQEMAPDAGMTAEPPAATEEVAPDATAPEVAPDQNLTDTETVAPETDADTMATDEQAETPDVAATDDGEIYVGEQATEEQLATNWIGQSLYNANDENLGDINDLLIDKDGTVKAVIVGVGGFLGIGEKDVAIDFDSIEPRTDEDGDVSLYFDATQEQLEAAPEFKTLADLEAERLADQPPPAEPMADPAMDPAAPQPAQ